MKGKGRECYHCKQWINPGDAHDCWTTTEVALTRELPEDLRDAWERLRKTAVDFGEQRVYASHQSIMFSRRVCYFFVRPKPKLLEVWFFLGRPLKASQVRKVMPSSKVKFAHMVHVRHRDEVEAPLTDWLYEAYDVSETLRTLRAPRVATKKPAVTKKAAKKQVAKKTRKTARKT